MKQFFEELRRRNVFKVAIAYLAAAWLLIQVIETLFPIFGLTDSHTRPVVILIIIGFPLTLIFSWLYELTPDGLKLERDVQRSRSIVYHTSKKLDRVIIIVLALSLAFFAVDKFVFDPARDADRERLIADEARNAALTDSATENSIAVLPFVDLSSSKDQEYFSDGISEELLNLLAKIPELRVAARTSSFSYKGKDVRVSEIGRQLNVAYILEGSIRKVGQDVRITAQLIDAKSDTHLFSETYDAEFVDIFGVQDDIASKIVESIRIELRESLPTATQVNAEAYELYLRGKYLNQRVTRDNLIKAVNLFERSIQIDSDYAPVWLSLGVAYRNQAQYGYRPLDEGTTQARRAIERGLILDPNSSTAWARLAVINLTHDRDFDAAQIAAQRALELEPNNSSVMSAAARIAVVFGRFDEAIQIRQKSVDSEPLKFGARLMLGWDQMIGGRLDDAENTLRELLELDPSYPIGHLLLGQVLLLKGDSEQALNEMNAETEQEWGEFGTILALHGLGRHEEEISTLNKYIEQYGDVWIYQIAAAHAFHDNADEAFEWLDRGYSEKDSGMILIESDPFFEKIRDDVRWAPLVTKLGLPNWLGE